MIRCRPLILGLFAVLAAAPIASAKQRATVSIVPSVSTAARGQTFDLAIRFKIDRDWHLYWLNPGESGQPPRVSWKTPSGVTVGPVQFPTPEQIMLLTIPPSTVFGYENELVLLAPVTVGAEAPASIDLTADMDWIVCKEACVAEEQTVSLTIPVGDSVTLANENDFAKWRSLQPKREGAPAAQVVIDADHKHGEVRVEIPQGMTPTTFFSPAAPFAEYQQPKIVDQPDGKRAYVTRFRILPGKHKDRVDPAVIVFKDSSGKSVAFEVVCNFAMDLR